MVGSKFLHSEELKTRECVCVLAPKTKNTNLQCSRAYSDNEYNGWKLFTLTWRGDVLEYFDDMRGRQKVCEEMCCCTHHKSTQPPRYF